MLKPDSVETWNNFQTPFTLAANDRKNMTTTTRYANFRSATNTSRISFDDTTTRTSNPTKSDISALTEAIMRWILSNSENFK